MDNVSSFAKNFAYQNIPDYVPEFAEEKTPDLFDVYTREWNKNGNLLLMITAIGLPNCEDLSDDRQYPCPDIDMIAYNEKRDFRCQLDPKKLDGPKLISFLGEKGLQSVKGYFWVFMEKGKRELTVITDPLHPAQPW